MTLFISADALAQRKRDLADPAALGGLAQSLQRELHAALDVPVPDGKSRLTRSGGRCTTCTVLLAFDPRSPRTHTCPSCGAVYTDEVHHQWWLMNGHLWTAEQCTRAAALAFLLDDERAAHRADAILADYTVRYLHWPNRDNALGPTRPFFSTYLESIWLLHLATALDLRIAARGHVDAQAAETFERLVRPSAALIRAFDEGRSNRQVWHCAAMLAAAGLLQDNGLRMSAVRSLESLLATGLHTDGSWYEGENYHLFAHRGLLSAVTLAERAGVKLDPALIERFELGFASPFRTMLPDGTFPARRDSQYGIALRQYRTADWAECGFARRDTPALRAALASLYAAWPDAGDTARWSSTADAERNQKGVRLTRADCSWRALLLARLDLPPLSGAEPHSELLEGQGLAVFRRKGGRLWVGLDYGDPGDGHGHPDRLNLVVAEQEIRWLDDVGTGSYTSPTLAWYRSSMAHNAPMANGRDQGAARGTLLVHDEQGESGWVSAEFVDPVSRVRFVRTVVVMSDHVLDEVTWTSDADAVVDVPMQGMRVVAAEECDGERWSPFTPGTAMDAWLSNTVCSECAEGQWHRLDLRALPSPAVTGAHAPPATFQCLLWSDGDATVWSADTIGPPAGAPHGVVSIRQQGRAGRTVRVLSRGSALTASVAGDGSVTISDEGDSARAHTHRRVPEGWRIDALHPRATGVTLRGARMMEPSPVPQSRPEAKSPLRVSARSSYLTTALAKDHYRPTEEAWEEAGEPTATLNFMAGLSDTAALVIGADVTLNRAPHFAARTAVNPLDNELPDVNSDGVQLHWRSPDSGVWNGLIAVPEAEQVRLTVVEGSADGVTARWQRTPHGYALWFEVPWPATGPDLEFDLIVNECPATRERRRGQLVLSGAQGETAYLRGARQSAARALRIVFDPASP